MLLAMMRITLAYVRGRSGAKDGFESLTETYLERCSGFARCATEGFRSEAALLERTTKQKSRGKVSILQRFPLE